MTGQSHEHLPLVLGSGVQMQGNHIVVVPVESKVLNTRNLLTKICPIPTGKPTAFKIDHAYPY